MKRYELHCQDHQQYDEVYDEARAWLQTTRDKLSVCTDTSGDRYTIQTQLEKLQVGVLSPSTITPTPTLTLTPTPTPTPDTNHQQYIESWLHHTDTAGEITGMFTITLTLNHHPHPSWL